MGKILSAAHKAAISRALTGKKRSTTATPAKKAATKKAAVKTAAPKEKAPAKPSPAKPTPKQAAASKTGNPAARSKSGSNPPLKGTGIAPDNRTPAARAEITRKQNTINANYKRDVAKRNARYGL